ncbi:MAG: NAD kinase [Weeksellaceae bacterium]
MRVAVYGMKASKSQKESFERFFRELRKKDIQIFIEEGFASVLKHKIETLPESFGTFKDYNDLPPNLDLFFTFGGDGTILRAVTIIRERKIPVVGVNTGRLGFLASLNLEFLFNVLDDVLSGNYILSSRSLIAVEADGVNIDCPFALNEISVTRRKTTSMITVNAYIDGEFLNAYWADGLIVATPTGSTGYSLSCGGPIVHPRNQVFIFTAISPHNLNVRPYIIPDDVTIELEVNSREAEYLISMDSRNEPLPSNVRLRLRKADFQIKFVIPKEITYLLTLREKMYWGSDKRN